MQEIAGRTVFITGGAQGIGLGMARAFADAGARVALADIDEERLAAASRELSERSAGPGSVGQFVLDVRDRAAFAQVVDDAEDRLGPISILCNNAGLGSVRPVAALGYEHWDLVLGVNLGGVVNGLQTVLPRMLDRGGPGHIVNTASGAGIIAGPNLSYATSKFAVVGLSESLRQQPELVSSGIGVTVVAPGFVRTSVIRNSARLEGGADDPRTEIGHAVLQERGLSPDVVGARVLAAVRAGDLYVLTDRYILPLFEERVRLITDAFPPETERDRELAPDLRSRLATLTPPIVGADR